MIDQNWAMGQNVSLARGTENWKAPRVMLGRAVWATFDCGDLLAVPVEMRMPTGCVGLLSHEFLQVLDMELDISAERARVVKAPQDSSTELPFDTKGLCKIPLETFESSVQGMPVPLMTAPLQIRLQGGVFQVTCTAVFDLSSGSACSKSTISGLELNDVDYCAEKLEIQIPGGSSQVLRQANLSLAIGAGQDGPVAVEAALCIGHPALQKLGLLSAKPCAIVGVDLLRRAPFILSPRLGALWMHH
ncbi:unnamed protein product [Polarella glacialis]|uniref:Uncharacterized protein n=1 Tax=Polarella glacialis TaxID=89957 RepID=A0A813LS57_POLGL|nr:unnamed protein product [Polarella glacialis]